MKLDKQSLAGFAGKKSKKSLSQALMLGAVISVGLSALGYLGFDIWLASTQWLLVAVAMGLFGMYLK